jgi:hypothetical protein
MQGPLNPGDIVAVNHLGREFLGVVKTETVTGAVEVHPIPVNVTYYTVGKREITARWKFTKGKVPSSFRNGNLSYGREG